jgi:hypothetical protein
MSATLRVNDFAENRQLFDESPPLIHIAGTTKVFAVCCVLFV